MALPFLIVGAGLSGATLARALAEKGHPVHVIDERDHVAGNCHTEVDDETGVLVHRYGPHIFHTDDDRIWNFLSRYTEFAPYRHRVIALARGQMYRLPINLHTLCQFFGRSFTPDEAAAHLRASAVPIADPQTFEEVALATIGRALYETGERARWIFWRQLSDNLLRAACSRGSESMRSNSACRISTNRAVSSSASTCSKPASTISPA